MTTIKRNKMKVTIWGIMGSLLIAVWLLVPASQAEAKTVKVKYKIAGYLTRVEWIAVPDVEKHVVALYERRGVAIYENGETAAYHSRGTSERIQAESSFHGYTDYLFKDGSTIMTEYTGTMWYPPGEKLRSLKGEYKYIKGTGRFEGIKGKGSFTGKYVAPYTKDKTKGENVVDVTGTYTLPSK
jgi:hypothetical protein